MQCDIDVGLTSHTVHDTMLYSRWTNVAHGAEWYINVGLTSHTVHDTRLYKRWTNVAHGARYNVI